MTPFLLDWCSGLIAPTHPVHRTPCRFHEERTYRGLGRKANCQTVRDFPWTLVVLLHAAPGRNSTRLKCQAGSTHPATWNLTYSPFAGSSSRVHREREQPQQRPEDAWQAALLNCQRCSARSRLSNASTAWIPCRQTTHWSPPASLAKAPLTHSTTCSNLAECGTSAWLPEHEQARPGAMPPTSQTARPPPRVTRGVCLVVP
mmetsp:Transcript_29817/g.79278  ORF Transcript_29817/g.79278 Transcript_29817/m.79278 type:complete len:202 (-) Transcript_29817:994-1599(-)